MSSEYRQRRHHHSSAGTTGSACGMNPSTPLQSSAAIRENLIKKKELNNTYFIPN